MIFRAVGLKLQVSDWDGSHPFSQETTAEFQMICSVVLFILLSN